MSSYVHYIEFPDTVHVQIASATILLYYEDNNVCKLPIKHKLFIYLKLKNIDIV